MKDTEIDMCESCLYNTRDYVCYPHCSGCDGKSKYKVSGQMPEGLKK